MRKIFRLCLASGRKRRRLAVDAALWLLRLLRDVEFDEMYRNSELLDSFDSEACKVSRREYNAVEEEYMSCEYALIVLETAIDDLKCAY